MPFRGKILSFPLPLRAKLMSMKHLSFLFALIFSFVLPQVEARDSQVSAEVFTETSKYDPKGSNWIAVRLSMAEGWHIYWKNVGDSGLPTSFQLEMPDGIEVKQILWPAPISFDTDGLVSYGYHGKATWLIEIGGGSADPKGKLLIEWLECADVCLPGSTRLDLAWSEGGNTKEIFSEARRFIPISSDGFGSMQHKGDHLLWKPSKEGSHNWKFFPEDEGWVVYGKAQTWDSQLGLKIPIQEDIPSSGSIKGVIQGYDEEGATTVSIEGNWSLGSNPATDSAPSNTAGHLLWMLLFAFIGGLLLNVMPCVLPVLSLKIMQLLDHREERQAWKPSLAYTAGVLLSFQSLALVLILLRQGGSELGWGYQLQDPLVICGLLALFLLLALNMFGVFEIGVGLVGVDEKVKSKSKGLLLSSFAGGALATAAATPCSAPFMGAAVGFALTLDPMMNLLIFFFLGLGMAFPFLVIGFVPGALRFLPKPGMWMVTLKQGMGFLLMATVAYLFHVLVTLIDDSDRILNIGFALVLISFGAWVYGRSHAWKGRLLALVAVLASGWLMGPTEKHINWAPFNEDDIEKHLKAGTPVFIDFTASWCTNCKVNERVVLETDRAKTLFEKTGVIPMKADWSRFDPDITRYLSKLGRNSVPVYAVLNPDNPDVPQLLPETLTFSHLEEALIPFSEP